jgi:hypothetical protein
MKQTIMTDFYSTVKNTNTFTNMKAKLTNFIRFDMVPFFQKNKELKQTHITDYYFNIPKNTYTMRQPSITEFYNKSS